jgi:hypothetical protein
VQSIETHIRRGVPQVRIGGFDHRRVSGSFPLEPSAASAELIGYNLGNLWRPLALPGRFENWSLTSLQQRLVQHARCYCLLLAEGHRERSDSGRCWAGSHCYRCQRDREIGWSSPHRKSSYQRLGEEECCKNRAQNGAIPAVPVRMADRRNCSDERSFHNVANRQYGRTMVPFSGSKKEIPVKLDCLNGPSVTWDAA